MSEGSMPAGFLLLLAMRILHPDRTAFRTLMIG
jgi:hypothetical protein